MFAPKFPAHMPLMGGKPMGRVQIAERAIARISRKTLKFQEKKNISKNHVFVKKEN